MPRGFGSSRQRMRSMRLRRRNRHCEQQWPPNRAPLSEEAIQLLAHRICLNVRRASRTVLLHSYSIYAADFGMGLSIIRKNRVLRARAIKAHEKASQFHWVAGLSLVLTKPPGANPNKLAVLPAGSNHPSTSSRGRTNPYRSMDPLSSGEQTLGARWVAVR